VDGTTKKVTRKRPNIGLVKHTKDGNLKEKICKDCYGKVYPDKNDRNTPGYESPWPEVSS